MGKPDSHTTQTNTHKDRETETDRQTVKYQYSQKAGSRKDDEDLRDGVISRNIDQKTQFRLNILWPLGHRILRRNCVYNLAHEAVFLALHSSVFRNNYVIQENQFFNIKIR